MVRHDGAKYARHRRRMKVHRPQSLSEAVALAERAQVVGGATAAELAWTKGSVRVLSSIYQGLRKPAVSRWTGAKCIGAGEWLAVVLADPRIRQHLPMLMARSARSPHRLFAPSPHWAEILAGRRVVRQCRWQRWTPGWTSLKSWDDA